MIAAPAAGQLLICKINRPMRRAVACGSHRIGIGGSGDRGKMQFARIDGAGKFRLKQSQIKHRLA